MARPHLDTVRYHVSYHDICQWCVVCVGWSWCCVDVQCHVTAATPTPLPALAAWQPIYSISKPIQRTPRTAQSLLNCTKPWLMKVCCISVHAFEQFNSTQTSEWTVCYNVHVIVQVVRVLHGLYYRSTHYSLYSCGDAIPYQTVVPPRLWNVNKQTLCCRVCGISTDWTN